MRIKFLSYLLGIYIFGIGLISEGWATELNTYCTAQGNNPLNEWIAKVQLGTIQNPTIFDPFDNSDLGNGQTTYSDFTSLSTNLERGKNYQIDIIALIDLLAVDEYCKVWIDFNSDGDFSDAGENVLSQMVSVPAETRLTRTFSTTIQIPLNALLGSTRMRIAMKRGSYPGACEVMSSSDYGEVEDYTINIVPLSPPLDTVQYNVVKQKLDAGYIRLFDNQLRFTYDQDYAVHVGDNDQINYRLLDWQMNAAQTGAIAQRYGINRHTISLNSTYLDGNFYVLEVSGANKGEVYYLKFKYEP